MKAGLANEAVDQGEVEGSLPRLEKLPVDWREHGVEVEREEPLPEGPQVLQARRGGVVQLAAADQERPTVGD